MDHHKTLSRVPPPYVQSHSLFFCLPVLLARSYFLSRSLIEPAGPWFAPRFDNMSLLRKVASNRNLPYGTQRVALVQSRLLRKFDTDTKLEFNMMAIGHTTRHLKHSGAYMLDLRRYETPIRYDASRAHNKTLDTYRAK